MKLYTVTFIILVSAFIYQGCSELEDNLVVPDATNECSLCHGDKDKPYPPKALNGETSPGALGVGAHQKHLGSTSFSALVACSECHIPVESYWDSTHIGPNPDNIAEVTFGPLAKKSLGGGIIPNPQWNRTDATCSNTYCHGQFKGGNLGNIVLWKQPGSAGCGTCHGDPTTGNPNPKPYPTYVHDPNNTILNCVDCHRIAMDSTGAFKRTDLHVNGTINFNQEGE